MNTYEKYYNEQGEVAILYSPGFGAGWYTWNSIYPGLVFDKRIVEKVLQDHREEITENWLKSIGYDNVYVGGFAGDLEVIFLTPGTKFRIDEYDGSESVIWKNDFILEA